MTRHLHKTDSGACILDEIEPIGQIVNHVNQRTEFSFIEHVYQPDSCIECALISGLFRECDS